MPASRADRLCSRMLGSDSQFGIPKIANGLCVCDGRKRAASGHPIVEEETDILIRVDGAPGLAMLSKVAALTTGDSLIAALDKLLISGGDRLMAIDEPAAIQERVDRLWEAMTVEERRNYDRLEDEVIAILTFVRPLIESHEACREREEQLVANMTKLWVWILFAVAVVAYGLEFKVLAWTIAVLPLLVLLGGPVEAYFLIRAA